MIAAARNAEFYIDAIRKLATPCIVHAVLNTWLNGWCTNRRFQRRLSRCCADPACEGHDELEHYAVCPHLRHGAEVFLDIPSRPASFAIFLRVHSDWKANAVMRALHMYATRAVVHRGHHEAIRACSHADLLHLYRERLRHVACLSRPLRLVIPRL